jgi:hypothetical protein
MLAQRALQVKRYDCCCQLQLIHQAYIHEECEVHLHRQDRCGIMPRLCMLVMSAFRLQVSCLRKPAADGRKTCRKPAPRVAQGSTALNVTFWVELVHLELSRKVGTPLCLLMCAPAHCVQRACGRLCMPSTDACCCPCRLCTACHSAYIEATALIP